MTYQTKLYIDGKWADATNGGTIELINPSDETLVTTIASASLNDLEAAVEAAKTGFELYRKFTVSQRIELLHEIVNRFEERFEEVAQLISIEMGAPITLSRALQAPSVIGIFKSTIHLLKDFEFSYKSGSTDILLEPIGVCGLITPWNWPLHQVASKVAPALATGCSMILKPSEFSPLSAGIFCEVLHEAGVPAGVFNLLYGEGHTIGRAMSRHPSIDMMSITGSTRSGIDVAIEAAPYVKRVTQELGGKSPFIVLPGADLDKAVTSCVQSCFKNSGQSCNAPSRLLVAEEEYDEAVEIAKKATASFRVGPALSEQSDLGPLVNRKQYEHVQSLIQRGIKEGAELIAGGPRQPEGLEKGFFVNPTIFGNVHNKMSIAQIEVFGPVLCIIKYRTEEEALAIANDTEYGLSAYVFSSSEDINSEFISSLKVGMIHLNGAPMDINAPFGGRKKSGNGREKGKPGFDEFLEYKSVFRVS
jgi:aldehyde dehydrogenase (NAD+)